MSYERSIKIFAGGGVIFNSWTQSLKYNHHHQHRKMENGTRRGTVFPAKKAKKKRKKESLSVVWVLHISFLNKKRKRNSSSSQSLRFSGVHNLQVQAFSDAVVDATNLGKLENVQFEMLHTEQLLLLSYTFSMSL